MGRSCLGRSGLDESILLVTVRGVSFFRCPGCPFLFDFLGVSVPSLLSSLSLFSGFCVLFAPSLLSGVLARSEVSVLSVDRLFAFFPEPFDRMEAPLLLLSRIGLYSGASPNFAGIGIR